MFSYRHARKLLSLSNGFLRLQVNCCKGKYSGMGDIADVPRRIRLVIDSVALITGAVVCLVLFGNMELASAVRPPDVLLLPPPQYVVNEMLELAVTNQSDVV